MDYISIGEPYEDPDTGDRVEEFQHPETGEIFEIRNATSRDHRTNRSSERRTPTGRSTVRRTTTGHSGGSSSSTTDHRGRTETHTSGVPARYSQSQPATMTTNGEYLAIKKSAIGELLPLAGKIWAALRTQPDRPTYTGDDRADFENEALHREALARHEQNQLQIMAFSDVAGRALKLLMS